MDAGNRSCIPHHCCCRRYYRHASIPEDVVSRTRCSLTDAAKGCNLRNLVGTYCCAKLLGALVNFFDFPFVDGEDCPGILMIEIN